MQWRLLRQSGSTLFDARRLADLNPVQVMWINSNMSLDREEESDLDEVRSILIGRFVNPEAAKAVADNLLNRENSDDIEQKIIDAEPSLTSDQLDEIRATLSSKDQGIKTLTDFIRENEHGPE